MSTTSKIVSDILKRRRNTRERLSPIPKADEDTVKFLGEAFTVPGPSKDTQNTIITT
jgi:hypothetical protein